MKILSVYFKNFGSYGNSPTTIKFTEKNEIIGILGQNGSGKSTIIHALYFALFGKSFTGTNKPELVNRINQGDLVAGVEFEQKGDVYIIERGLKPVFIRIMKNNEEIALDSTLVNIQKYLEHNILEINETLFRQMFMIGMGNFKSFFTLPIAQRREIFEKIVGLNILSVMKKKVFLKDREFQQQIKDLHLKKESNLEKKKFYEDQIKKAQLISSNPNSELDIKKLEEEQKTIEAKIIELNKQISEIEIFQKELNSIQSEIEKRQENINEENIEIKLISNKLIELEEDIDFFKTHDICPECEQNIEIKFKESKIKSKEGEYIIKEKEKLKKQETLKKLNEEIAVFKKKMVNTQTKIKKNQQLQTTQTELTFKKKNIIEKIEYQIKNKEKEDNYSDSMIKEINDNIASLVDDILDIKKESKKIKNNIDINDKMSFVLSDDGFKKYVYTNFLPLLNKYVTENLKFFDFSMNFYLDSNLTENFYERMGENISFSTLSNGEKQVSELAFLFALQRFLEEIYNFKLDCQFFDELFDTSLDSDKLYYLLNFLKTLNKKIIIISHNPSVNENFDKLYRVVRESHFSHIQEI